MKAIIVSDSHGRSERLSDIFKKNRDADHIIFLGDGERDLEEALAENDIDPYDPGCRIKVTNVCGNCDFFSHEPATVIEEIDGLRVLITHGFRQYVKYGYDDLVREARENRCDIALFGHTHRRHLSEEDGITIFNPGSVLGREYGIMKINNGECSFEFYDF